MPKQAVRKPASLQKAELRLRREYEESHATHVALGQSVKATCEALLGKHGVPFHSVKMRVKTCRSVLDKMARKGYRADLVEVKDLVGVRVVCLYGQHIDPVVRLLSEDFDVIETVDKRPASEPDRFGYSSVHLLCRLGRGRTGLAEYSPSAKYQFEIQVRTILQEAWAEIEHRLIYKGGSETPPAIRRAIARTAAMLESADLSFDDVLRKHDDYKALLGAEDARQLHKEPLNVTSLREAVRRELPWSKGWEAEHGASKRKLADLNELVSELRSFDIRSVSDLVRLIHEYGAAANRVDRREYRDAVRDQKHGHAERALTPWQLKTKRYFMPVGFIRELLRRKFRSYDKLMAPIWDSEASDDAIMVGA